MERIVSELWVHIWRALNQIYQLVVANAYSLFIQYFTFIQGHIETWLKHIFQK